MTMLQKHRISQLLLGTFIVLAAAAAELVCAHEESAACAQKGSDGNAEGCVDPHVTLASNSVLQVMRLEEDGVAGIQAAPQTDAAALTPSGRWTAPPSAGSSRGHRSALLNSEPTGGHGAGEPAADAAGGDPPIPEQVSDKKPPPSAAPTTITRPAPGTQTTLLKGPLKCERGRKILDNLTTSDNFQVDFDLVAYGPRDGWTGIFRITKSKFDRGHHFDRMPAFYMRPGTLDLDAVMGKDVVGHDNDLIEDPFQLKLGETHHVTGRLEGDTWQLFVDGEQMHNLGGYTGTKFPPMEGAEVWITDKFYPPSNVAVSNLVYTVLAPDPPMAAPLQATPKTQMPVTEERKVEVGRLVTNRLTTGRNFEVSFNVTPTNLARGWSSILRITKSYKDVGHHFDRMPAFFFKPKSTELFAVMGREHEFEDNEYVETDYQLPMLRTSKVVGRLYGDNWTLSVNGRVLHTLRGYKERRFPAMMNASVWIGDRFYMPAQANISYVNYTILPDDEEDAPPVTDFIAPPQPGKYPIWPPGQPKQKVKYGYALPETITTGRNFEVSFDIKPIAKSEHMTSIIRLTKTSTDEGHFFDRMPAIFFYPESTLVHVVMGRIGDPQAHVNPTKDLPLNTKSRVKVRLQGNSLTININGKEEARLNGFDGYAYMPTDNVTVWIGDKFYQPAEAWLYGLNYTILPDESPVPTPAPPPQSTEMVKKPTATGKGYKLPKRFNTTRNFQLCLAITPYGRKPVWRSIIRFTKSEKDKGGYWDRMPALFFKPGSTEIRAVMANQANYDTYVESYSELKLKMTSRVCMRVEGDLLTLTINGVLADLAPGYCGTKYQDTSNVSVWVGDKFYDSADAELLSVNYTTIPDDVDYPTCLTVRNESTVPLGPLIKKPVPGTPMLKDPRRIQFGRLLADAHSTGRNFEVSFDITPYSKKGNRTSILRFTKTENNKGSKFDNMPGFFFQPKSTTVIAVMGRSGEHHASVPSSQEIPINRTSTVKARLDGDRFTLWINGSFAGALAGFQGLAYPANSDVSVWSGDRFHPPADASISNINYTALPDGEEPNADDGSTETPSDGSSDGENPPTGSPGEGSEGDYWAGEPDGDSEKKEAADEEGPGDGEASDGEGSGEDQAGAGEGSGDGEAGAGEGSDGEEAPAATPAATPATTASEKAPPSAPETTASEKAPAPVPETTAAEKAPAPMPATTAAEKADGSMTEPKSREATVPLPDKAPAPTEAPPSKDESSKGAPEEPNKRNWLALGNLALGFLCLILLMMLLCRR